MSQDDQNEHGMPSALRRKLLMGLAAAPALAMSGIARAQQYPTAKVNTTHLAVTDTEVTVGQLHSATGTMAISETGSIQAERLAIDQINAAGGILGRKIKIIQEDGASTGLRSPKSPKSCSKTIMSRRCSAAGRQPRVRRCCRSSNAITASCTTRLL